MTELTPQDWDTFLAGYPNAHLLQTAAWGELKKGFGWQVSRIVHADMGAQILFKMLPFGFSFAYIPKGPVGDQWDAFLPEMDRLCRQNRVLFIKVEPDDDEGRSQWDAFFLSQGFKRSRLTIQPKRTLIVDITGSEDDVLARMKQKTRYNIRLAAKKGVTVNPSSDIDIFYNLLSVTQQRDQFGIHTKTYYQTAYDLFHSTGECELLIAKYDSETIAGLMVFSHGKRAWYLYGASTDLHRDRMPTYLLQWEAIRWARERGCVQYDLWGVPDEDQKQLEANFINRQDGLWGVYRFKRGFGAELHKSSDAWDRVHNTVLYTLIAWWLDKREARYSTRDQ